MTTTNADLSEFYGCCCLTPEEKKYRLEALKRCISNNEVDEEFIPYLNSLNDFPFLCTTQCCTGHPERDNTAHVDFRTWLSFEDVFRCTAYIVNNDAYNAALEIMGQETLMPRYCLWIYNQSNWKAAVEALIEEFEDLSLWRTQCH